MIKRGCCKLHTLLQFTYIHPFQVLAIKKLPEEEPRLMAHLSGPRTHLKPAVVVAFGTGMRMGEQLRMKRHRLDDLPFSLMSN